MEFIMFFLGVALMLYSTVDERLDKYYVSGQVWMVGSIIINILGE